MSHVIAVALRSFMLGKEIKRKSDKPFPLPTQQFLQLKGRNLVAEAEGEQAPKPQPGTASSASPAAPASQPQTAPSLATGGKRQAAKAKP